VSAEVTFRLGDKLIVRRNNYQTLCFNGETGEIVDISSVWLTLRTEDAYGERLVDYEREDWPQLQLAYAITSHHAQGSEWDNAVVVVSQSHYMMLQRNLLYTALTRARKRAVVIVSGGRENKQTGRIFKTALEVAVARWSAEQADGLIALLLAHMGYLHSHGHALAMAHRAFRQACLKVSPSTSAMYFAES
jgi:ATP-dependent exoDNAse (exonuclease V) alpha subunit